jgi:hypothetical protein
MDLNEAISLVSHEISGYFVDDPTNTGIEQMRKDYLTSKSHPEWARIQSAFRMVLEHGPDAKLEDLVRDDFNRHVPMLQGGARGFLEQIYRGVFETE